MWLIFDYSCHMVWSRYVLLMILRDNGAMSLGYLYTLVLGDDKCREERGSLVFTRRAEQLIELISGACLSSVINIKSRITI